MTDDDTSGEVDLSPHRLAPSGVPDEEPRAGALTTIVGFVGAGRSEGQIRVYVNLSFASYYEVKAADVVRTKAVDRDDPDTPRVLWINADAKVRLVRVGEMSGTAAFVKGALRKQYSAKLAGGGDPVFVPANGTDFWFCDDSLLCVTAGSGWPYGCAPGTDVWPQCGDCL